MINNKKAFAVVGVIFILTAALSTLLFSKMWVSDVVTDGEYHGLKIGDSKEETFRRLPLAISEINNGESRMFIRVQVRGAEMAALIAAEEGQHVLVETDLHSVGFGEFSRADRWTIHFRGSYLDILRLTFCDGKLCRIYRTKKPFEIA